MSYEEDLEHLLNEANIKADIAKLKAQSRIADLESELKAAHDFRVSFQRELGGRIADQDRKIEALEAENARLREVLRDIAYFRCKDLPRRHARAALANMEEE